MVITFTPKIELYQSGFFVGSFDSMRDVEDYMKHYINDRGVDLEEMNKLNFTVIEKSKHLTFT